MKRLMSVLVCLSFAGALAFGAAFMVCREWGRLPFAEYESECGLETGSMVQGRVCYDFSEDKLNATRFCELRETAESWKSDLFHERVMASVRMNAVVSKIGTNEALRIIRSTQVEVVPRQCSVLVRTKGRDLKSVVEVAEIYALEISRAGSESEVERSEKILSQLARNLECQTTVVSKIERRLSALQLEHSIIRSNEIAKLQKELVSAKSLCKKMEMQFVNTKTSFKCGTMGSFVRMSRKAAKTKMITPSFWEVWFWLFPVLLLVIVIMFRRGFLMRLVVKSECVGRIRSMKWIVATVLISHGTLVCYSETECADVDVVRQAVNAVVGHIPLKNAGRLRCLQEFGYKYRGNPSYGYLSNVVSNNFEHVYARFNLCATNELNRLVLLSTAWAFGSDFYLCSLSKDIDLVEAGVLSKREFLWVRDGSRDVRLNGLLPMEFNRPGVSNLVLRMQQVIGETNYCQRILSGEAKQGSLQSFDTVQ